MLMDGVTASTVPTPSVSIVVSKFVIVAWLAQLPVVMVVVYVLCFLTIVVTMISTSKIS